MTPQYLTTFCVENAQHIDNQSKRIGFQNHKIQKSYQSVIKIGNVELGEFPLLLAPMEDVRPAVSRFVQTARRGHDVHRVYFERWIDTRSPKKP